MTAPLQPPTREAVEPVEVVVVRREACPHRRRRIVRLLALIMDKDLTPGDGQRS